MINHDFIVKTINLQENFAELSTNALSLYCHLIKMLLLCCKVQYEHLINSNFMLALYKDQTHFLNINVI